MDPEVDSSSNFGWRRLANLEMKAEHAELIAGEIVLEDGRGQPGGQHRDVCLFAGAAELVKCAEL